MARIGYWQYMVDKQGNPLQDAEVRVYLAGTNDEANIYLNSTFGSFTTSSVIDLKTNKFGFVQFWVGDKWETEGGYDVTQQFKIVWQNIVDSIQEEIDNLYLFTPVRPIVTSDDVRGVPSNVDEDKVISNKQGYKWDTHVDSIVPSSAPHDLNPVVFFDLNGKPNRIISDKIGYQMYTMAELASITPIDISAARFHGETVSLWTTSGGKFYSDINHNFNNYYPTVSVVKASDLHEIIPEKIESIDMDNIRIG